MGNSKEQDIGWQQQMNHFEKAVHLIEEFPRLQPLREHIERVGKSIY